MLFFNQPNLHEERLTQHFNIIVENSNKVLDNCNYTLVCELLKIFNSREFK